MKQDELRARLALCALPGLTDATRLELLRGTGSARAVLHAKAGALDRGQLARLKSPRFQRRIETALRTVSMLDVRVLSPVDPDFPMPAEPIPPPPFLFARGDVGLLSRRCVAIVGTRRSTEYGEDVAAGLAAALARAGVVVISGLARGIDGVAHRAALHAGGSTVAVLGCGIDVAYPREHAELQEEIAERGLLLSEFLPGESPRPYWFLQRNRLIAGLAAATVVVEGGATSGAINTAHHALSAHLPVFGVPGPLGRGTSEGPNALVRDGAHLFTEPIDVLLAIGATGAAVTAVRPAGPGTAATQAAMNPPARPDAFCVEPIPGLGRDAKHVDDIATAWGDSAAAALAKLLDLELDGRVEQLPGMRFRLARRAAEGTPVPRPQATVRTLAGITRP
jgi:DNA processing protein